MHPKRLILLLLWLAFFVAYLDRTNIAVAGPTMMQALHLTPQQFGFLLAAFTGGYALMQIPGGVLADRFGAKRMLLAALVLWSLFTGATGLAASLGVLILVRFCFGIGEGLESGAHFKALGDTFSSHERSAASGIFHTALALGPALISPVATLTIANLGWRALFVLLTLPGLLVAVLVWRFFPVAGAASEQITPASPAAGGSWRGFATRPGSWAAFAAYLFFNIAFWGLLNWLPSYLATARHIELRALGTLASIPYLCGFVGLLALGLLGRTWLYPYRPALLAVSYLLAGGGLYLAFTAQDIARSMLGLSLAAFFLYGGFGPFWALVLDQVPAGVRGAFGGFVNLGGQIGGFFSPLVVGAVLQSTKSFSGCFLIMIAALVLAAALLLGLGRTQLPSGQVPSV